MLKQYKKAFIGIRFLALCLLLVCISQTISSQSLTQKKRNLEREKQKIMQEIRQSNEILKNVENTTKATLTKVRILERKIHLRKKNIDIIKQEINDLDTDIGDNTSMIDQLESDLAILKEQYARSIVFTFKSRNNMTSLSFLFSSEGFFDFINRLYYIENYRKYIQEKVKKIKKNQIVLDVKGTDLQKQKKSKASKLHSLEIQYKYMANDKKEKDKLVRSLRRKRSQLKKDIQAKRRKWTVIRNSIKGIIKKQMEKDRKSEASRGKGVTIRKEKSNPKAYTPRYQTVYDKKFTQLFVKNKGKMLPPVSAPLKMGFGEHPIYKGSSIMFNNTGYTYQVKNGIIIKVIAEGVVVNIQQVLDGKMVSVRHGNYYSIYLPVRDVLVREGEILKLRQSIGTFKTRLGKEGEFEFQLLKQLEFLNPQNWVR